MLRAPAHSIPALPHELCDFLPLYLGFLICKMEGRMLEPVRGGGWALPCAAPPTPTLAAPTRRACVRLWDLSPRSAVRLACRSRLLSPQCQALCQPHVCWMSSCSLQTLPRSRHFRKVVGVSPPLAELTF